VPRNICLTIQYDGSSFCGWQTQKNLPTVQETLETAIHKLTKEFSNLHGAGRTDAGVHALGQRANFITSATIPTDRIPIALNSMLPAAIRVTDALVKPLDFHARFAPNIKHYRYSIETTSIGSPLRRNYVWQRHGIMDEALLYEAAELIVGTHNFKAFCASGSVVKNFTRTVYASTWSREGDLLCYDITGNGFLYNMVRLLVGGMSHIASGKWSLADLSEALRSGERSGTLYCAPPQGLCLVEVRYHEM
jgi:tRNA pseudouridine38-40 synthase